MALHFIWSCTFRGQLFSGRPSAETVFCRVFLGLLLPFPSPPTWHMHSHDVLAITVFSSSFVNIATFSSTTSDSIVNNFKSIFAWLGIPDVVDSSHQWSMRFLQPFSLHDHAGQGISNQTEWLRELCRQ